MVTILSSEGDGTPTQELLDTVLQTLNAEEVRPLTDEVLIQAPTQIYHYNIQANLYFYSGPDPEVVRQVALEKVTEYVTSNHLLGHDITESGLHAAIHQPGVQRAEIISPTGGTIVVGHTETAVCDSIELLIKGVDE
jgi:phage-related baseplate assembly protein